ncbi:hypothetical protein FB446DRAFT_772646 [Lentinula raphanica]|nr:hypothetical protein FB446DRAFT_772646 [Lentinula raphanica]
MHLDILYYFIFVFLAVVHAAPPGVEPSGEPGAGPSSASQSSSDSELTEFDPTMFPSDASNPGFSDHSDTLEKTDHFMTSETKNRLFGVHVTYDREGKASAKMESTMNSMFIQNSDFKTKYFEGDETAFVVEGVPLALEGSNYFRFEMTRHLLGLEKENYEGIVNRHDPENNWSFYDSKEQHYLEYVGDPQAKKAGTSKKAKGRATEYRTTKSGKVQKPR